MLRTNHWRKAREPHATRPVSAANASGPGRVVHVVGRVTDEVFSFLGPATAAIARTGAHQSIVMIDDVLLRHHVARLNGFAQLVLTPKVGNPIKQWTAVRRGCKAQLMGNSIRPLRA